MVTLINKSDRNIMGGIKYVKNASFFKDLLAFYDAYEFITNRAKQELPNYCFLNDKLLLDGLCLLIKDLATEFKFSSLNPSISYLKILYFSMASYSKEGEFPSREDIINDFENYKKACLSVVEKSKQIIQRNETEYNELESNFKKQKTNLQAQQKALKANSYLMVMSIIGIVIAVTLCLIGALAVKSSLAVFISISSLIFVVSVILLVFVLKKRNKLQENFKLQQAEFDKIDKERQSHLDALTSDKNLAFKFFSEFYDYNSELVSNLYESSKHDLVAVLRRMAGNKFLSYNLKYDIFMTASNQDKEIDSIVQSLNDSNCSFDEIYKKITEKSWLYYNGYVRLKFISKLYKSANQTHNYTVNIDGGKKYPFDMDIKKLLTEKIAFLANDKSKIYCFPVNYAIKSKILEKYQLTEFSSIDSIDELKYNKMLYVTHFFDPNKIQSNEKDFFEYKPSTSEIEGLVQTTAKIPTLFEIDEKVRTAELGYENSNAETLDKIIDKIVEISKTQDEDLIQDLFPEIIIDENSYLPFEDEFDSVDDIDSETVKCNYAGKSSIGFKIDIN